jgi:hypothetical protein
VTNIGSHDLLSVCNVLTKEARAVCTGILRTHPKANDFSKVQRITSQSHGNITTKLRTSITHDRTGLDAVQAQQTAETTLRETHENHVGSSSSRRGRLKVCSEMLAFESALRATFVYIDISQPPRWREGWV